MIFTYRDRSGQVRFEIKIKILIIRYFNCRDNGSE